MNVTPTPPPTQPPRSGASAAVICAHHGLGGAGAVDLAEAVVAATAGPKPDFKFLYDVNISIKVCGGWGLGVGGRAEGAGEAVIGYTRGGGGV